MSTLKATTLSNLAGDKTIPVDRVAQGVAAAWVNFNGTGTPAIRASYNVSSITDNGVGDYTINLTTALASTNYAAVVTGLSTTGSTITSVPQIFGTVGTGPTGKTTSAIRVTNASTAANVDCADISAVLFI